MNTIEDFKSAPAGATATHKATGNRVMKVDGVELRWITRWGRRLNDKEVVRWGFTLYPIEPAPTTAREALELAWELAHEVKPGQEIPEGTRYLKLYRFGVQEYTTGRCLKITPDLVPIVRTLDTLPDPEPDWIDAPAVLDVCGCCGTETLHSPIKRGTCWECTECHTTKTWRTLTDVTPLYPKEDA